MKNKKYLFLIFIIGIFLSLYVCSNKKEVLNIYSWGDYIDGEIIKDFESQYNVKVIYNVFASNEDMYISIKKGGNLYDVVFPSDYMIERMIDEDLLQAIDYDIVKNVAYIDENLLDKDFDPKNIYSVPYFWGTVGIAYNSKYIDKSDLQSWKSLWNPKFEKDILMIDSQRDAFAIALKALGYSMNTSNIEELEEARDFLIDQKDLVYAYVGDEIKDLMVGEEANIALVWSGDALAMINENQNLKYIIPEEGTNIWFDNMVIPKNSPKKELANEFINFLNIPEIAAKNAEYIEYSTANMAARNLLNEDIKNNPIAYPESYIIENGEIFKDPRDMLKIYSDLWIEVKARKK